MTRDTFKNLCSKNLLILDGATGTEFIRRGMPGSVCTEQWALDNKDTVAAMQREYKHAGSALVYTPTFGGNRYKLSEFGLGDQTREINTELARRSRESIGDTLLFGDLAPTGKFVDPFGDLAFEDAVACYKEQAAALAGGGVDGFVIETMMDIQEARAALIAVRELDNYPVMVSMTFDNTAHTLNGTDPVSALITLQALGADAVGCNCSTGPSGMIDIITTLKPHARVPLCAKPNAGHPRLVDGVTTFDMGPDEFGSYGPAFIKAGAAIIGGCCGTTPAHIAAVRNATQRHTVAPPQVLSVGALSSARQTVFLGQRHPFAVVGERINPTGKKALQAELRKNSLLKVKQYAQEQARRGAAVLDVNMGLSGIDEMNMMLNSIRLLSRMSPLPLCIDTSNPAVAEAALRLCPGRALVNSISGERERIEKTLPAAARYGAMIIALPLTDQGIPPTAAGRIAVVESLVDEAALYGCTVDDLVVDGLVMTISSNPEAAAVTLDCIEWSTNTLGSNSIVGLSNVSFGMPERKWINTAFLGMAMGRGLSMAIANPSSDSIMAAVQACNALRGKDTGMHKRNGELAE
ncbi:MAG: 5-methyltetrahydrofolate--homocysteine methyltransferase [Chitinivibrionales bacterium]|nr:5-methyltetrahydrofolate--homocysteine methyltransferase [Chitinivibrionales bacterium]